jgi:hypothetical protein
VREKERVKRRKIESKGGKRDNIDKTSMRGTER